MITKIAIIGSGNMARAHLNVLTEMDDVKVVGIYSRKHANAKVLAEQYKIGIVANSIPNLYEATKADGIIIAVTETSTAAVCIDAFQFPWKLLIEKPVGLTIQESLMIATNATAAKAEVFVALNRRYYGSVFNAINFLNHNNNEPRFITIHDQEAPKLARQAGRNETVISNWHLANSVHLIDLFFSFARGEISQIRNIIPWKGEGSMVTHSIINFTSGDIGIYHSLWDAPGPWSVVIETKALRVSMQPVETLSIQRFPSRQREVVSMDVADTDFKPGFLLQMKQFLAAINGESSSLCDLNQYLKTVQLVECLYKDVEFLNNFGTYYNA